MEVVTIIFQGLQRDRQKTCVILVLALWAASLLKDFCNDSNTGAADVQDQMFEHLPDEGGEIIDV